MYAANGKCPLWDYYIWLEGCQGFEARLATSRSLRACLSQEWLQGIVSSKLSSNFILLFIL